MTDWRDISPACEAVASAVLPSPDDGGPCATCAFRPGTEANQSWHTMQLAALCVEGFRVFSCHERPDMCRGFEVALNLRGVPEDDDDRKWCAVAGEAADVLARCIDSARSFQEESYGGS